MRFLVAASMLHVNCGKGFKPIRYDQPKSGLTVCALLNSDAMPAMTPQKPVLDEQSETSLHGAARGVRERSGDQKFFDQYQTQDPRASLELANDLVLSDELLDLLLRRRDPAELFDPKRWQRDDQTGCRGPGSTAPTSGAGRRYH
jgi:hypothetical protein